MSAFLKKLSNIDSKTKYSVYGWIRKAEEELKLGHIPLLISSICILYFHDDAIFDITAENIKLSKDKKCITKLLTKGWDNVCYGITKIQSNTNNIYRWDMKINKLIFGGVGIQIGISNIFHANTSFDNYNAGFQYIQWGDGDVFHPSDRDWNSENDEEFWIQENDKVSIVLNLKTATMICSVDHNGEIFEIKHKNIKKSDDIIYRFGVSLFDINDSIEIIDFSRNDQISS